MGGVAVTDLDSHSLKGSNNFKRRTTEEYQRRLIKEGGFHHTFIHLLISNDLLMSFSMMLQNIILCPWKTYMP